MRSNLVVDIGNTMVKVAVMRSDEVHCEERFVAMDAEAYEVVSKLVAEYGIERAIVSSTRGDGGEVVSRLRDMICYVVLFDAALPVPIENSYATPSTLGRDRLAAAVGAKALYSADNYLIVDLGSALTIDLVTREGGFEGGVISPGVSMRFRSLHDYTARLPLCSPTDAVVDVARTTNEAIEQGVMMGITYEIEGHITKILSRKGKNVIIFTGGDAKKLVNRIKNTIFARRELVLVGLNRILEYNAE